jgi:hypothetical protein
VPDYQDVSKNLLLNVQGTCLLLQTTPEHTCLLSRYAQGTITPQNKLPPKACLCGVLLIKNQ